MSLPQKKDEHEYVELLSCFEPEELPRPSGVLSDPFSVADIYSAVEANYRHIFKNDDQECIALGIATPFPGRDEEALLAGRVRAMMVLQQPCCKWVDEVFRIYSEVDGVFRVTFISCWSSFNAHDLFVSSWASKQYFKTYGYILESVKLKAYERLSNPFHTFGKKRPSANQQIQKFNPFNARHFAVSVFIEVSPKHPNCHSLFMRLLFASEACAIFEEGCLRYIVMKDHVTSRRKDKVFVYAVFADKESFLHHSRQGYSILGERFDEVCFMRPVVLTFTRDPLVMNQVDNQNNCSSA